MKTEVKPGQPPLPGVTLVETRVDPARRAEITSILLHVNSGPKPKPNWYVQQNRPFFLGGGGGGGLYNHFSNHFAILSRFFVCHLSSPCFQFLISR